MKNHFLQLTIIVVFLFQVFTSCNTKTSTKEKLKETDSAHTTQSAIKKDDSSTTVLQDNSIKNSKTDENNSSTVDFIIISATSQRWTGGIKGAGSGINYRFKLNAKFSSTEMIFDKLWIDTTFHTIQVKKLNSQENSVFSKNDTIIIYASDYFKSPDRPKFEGEEKENPATEKPNIKPPYKYSGAALIGYTIKGQRKYKTIQSIQKLNSLNAP